jgi:hypothetical protein
MYSKTGLLLLLVLAVYTGSCGNRSKKEDFSIRDKVLADSLGQQYKESRSFSFADGSMIFADAGQATVKDTLAIATALFIDSVFYMEKDSHQVKLHAITYVKKGKVNRGIMADKDVAIRSFISKKDPGVLFLANYVPVNDQTAAIIKSIRDNKLEAELPLDTSYMEGFEMDMFLADSLKLAHTTELFYLNTYYPACGYVSSHYYIDYANKKFQVILQEESWADAPYYSAPNIYFPTALNSKDLLYQVWGNNIQRDTSNNALTHVVSDQTKLPLNELIYIEYWQNKDSLVDGVTMADDYGDPLLADSCYGKKLYHWTGQKLELVK